jgi:hypothetical protein
LSKILSNISIPVLFADRTSVIITNYNPTDFQTNIKEVFEHLNTWFNLNLLSLILTEPILLISKGGIPAA